MPQLDSLTFPSTASTVSRMVGQIGNRLGTIEYYLSFCLNQTVRRDQVCPRSNKRGYFISYPLFARHKPHPICHTGHLRLPLSCRCFYELDVKLSLSQSLNDNYNVATPFGGRKSVRLV